MSRFPVKTFNSHSAEKLCEGILQILREFRVWKSFMNEHGRYHVFPSKIFGLSAEKFRGLPFNVSENVGCRKNLCIIGSITITFLRRKCFVSQCQKNSWTSLQCFRKIRVSKIFMYNRGYHVFPAKKFFLTVPKYSIKKPFSVSIILCIKNC